MSRSIVIVPILAFGLATPVFAGGPTTSINPEYLATMNLPLDTPQPITDSLSVYPLKGGAIEGPRIIGKILAPAADWGRMMSSGVFRIDVRATIQTDDSAMIYLSYEGNINCSKEKWDQFAKGEQLKEGDCYFITAPRFETKAEKYKWLNEVQAVGKMVSVKGGNDGYVRYDLFVIR